MSSTVSRTAIYILNYIAIVSRASQTPSMRFLTLCGKLGKQRTKSFGPDGDRSRVRTDWTPGDAGLAVGRRNLVGN